MEPPSEMVHWLFGMCLLLLGLIMLAEVIVGPEVWRRRAWRIYLWPGIAFGLGVAMWPVWTFFTNSAIHMVAHGAGAGADGDGRRRARARKGSSRAVGGSSRLPLASRCRVGLPRARAERLVLRALGVLHHLVGWTLIGASLPDTRARLPAAPRFSSSRRSRSRSSRSR